MDMYIASRRGSVIVNIRWTRGDTQEVCFYIFREPSFVFSPLFFSFVFLFLILGFLVSNVQ